MSPAPRRLSRASVLAILGLLVTACQIELEDPKESTLSEVWPLPGGSLFLTQLENSDLVAIDAHSGRVRQRYRHFGVPRRADVELPRSRLVCAPLPTPSGPIYLVFTDYLLSLAPATATVRWRLRLRLPMPRGLCPSAAPDGGLVMITQRGHAITKLDSSGNEQWKYMFPDRAVAIAGPTVIPETGDTVIRAGNDVFNLSPSGDLNSRRPGFP